MATPLHRKAPGSSYFVTTRSWQGRKIFQVAEVAEIIVKSLFHYREQSAYLLHEFVLMPDHLHLLLTPSPKTSLEKALQLIKGGSSRQIHNQRGQRMEIWQRGFYDWTIRDAEDWQRKSRYIHMNPVHAKLVQRPEEWPCSSANPRFALEPMPEKFGDLASGAKARVSCNATSELKLRPPKEESGTSQPPGTRSDSVGPEGPTPNSKSAGA